MNDAKIVSIIPEMITTNLLEDCCELFNSNFEKVIDEKPIKIYPSRLQKYLVNSQLFCAYKENSLVGYMIVEKMSPNLIWIKQIVIKKSYRNQKLATQLVDRIINYKYIGIISNNPIMIKILKSLGYMINQNEEQYVETFLNPFFKQMSKLYNIDNFIKKENHYLAFTHLSNIQTINCYIDYSPLKAIKSGYEWTVIFETDDA